MELMIVLLNSLINVAKAIDGEWSVIRYVHTWTISFVNLWCHSEENIFGYRRIAVVRHGHTMCSIITNLNVSANGNILALKKQSQNEGERIP